MIQDGWKFKTTVENIAEKHIMNLTAEPVLAEVDEKIREVSQELIMKIAQFEMGYALMITPLETVRQMKELCENELDRRMKEYEEQKSDN